MNLKICKTKSCQNLVTENEYYCGDCRLADFHNDAELDEEELKELERIANEPVKQTACDPEYDK